MKLKHVMLGLVLMVLSTTAWAVDCNVSAPGLSTAQLEQIEKACEATAPLTPAQETAAKVEATAAQVTEVAEQANQWGPMAKDFAQAIGIAAKELGIAANDFLDSPAGVLTAVLIAWKVAGAELAGMLVCGALIIFVCYVSHRLLTRVIGVKEISYESVPLLWGALQYRRITKVDFEHASEAHGWMYVVTVLASVVSVATLVGVGF